MDLTIPARLALRKPRIGFVTYAMNCGGMEAFILHLGKYLKEHGCNVEVITTEQRGEWFGRCSEVGLASRHYGADGSQVFVNAIRQVSYVGRRLAEDGYDVVFLNHARYAQAGLAFLPAATSVVAILHNTFNDIFTVGCSNRTRLNALVAVSPKVASLAARGNKGRPIVTIPNGVRLPSRAAFGDRRDFERPLRIIFVGRLDHTQKGVLLIPSILQGCLERGVDCTFDIVGDGPDLEALKNGLSRFVGRYRIHGRLDEDEVYRMLLDSHIFLLPSFFEGLSIAQLEAQACGCVPVASKLEGSTDFAIESGVDGFLVEAGHVDGFVDAIATLYQSPSRWRAFSKQARGGVEKRFSIDVMGAAYAELIVDLLAGRYPRPLARRGLPIDLSLFSWRELLPTRVRNVRRALKTRFRC